MKSDLLTDFEKQSMALMLSMLDDQTRKAVSADMLQAAVETSEHQAVADTLDIIGRAAKINLAKFMASQNAELLENQNKGEKNENN